MNFKLGLALVTVLLVAGLLAARHPVWLLNALTPGRAFTVSAGIPYGPGERQRLDVYVPARAAAGSPGGANPGLPIVVFFYGGSWQSGERGDYRFVGAALAARGFVAVVPDYRTYPATVFPGFMEDAAQAVAWAREHAAQYGADPHRLVLMGHSAGAQIAALLATDGRYLAARQLRRNDIAGVVGLAGPYDFLPLRDATLEQVFPAQARAASQPIRFVKGGEAPMWLAVAEQDTVVEPGNTERFARALRDAGDQVSVMRYRRLSHATLVGVLALPLRPLAPVLDDLAAFVDRIAAVPGQAAPRAATARAAAPAASEAGR
ncbi:alpha/beta hydrolase [Burkholderia glumae]|uniref:alpha/beta hydrolase n=1 Tax=Burkholderia glumae TaxID=337 RepID=UPI0020375192|nr:alpha/beta hydrolase [Burkholderia glumae]MCM2495925.1 alpha/beta hydrolase [Burkholderia glumae]MCM2546884.1 alpha/beta hydrolase [Burkholderia glumae]UVS98524.1 alpha/beta hydrolase [Burkholderia glumae]